MAKNISESNNWGSDYSLRVNSSLAELNSTRAIAVYLEVEFHDHTTGANWIINNVKAIGEAICKGVCDYYGITYKKLAFIPINTLLGIEKIPYKINPNR